MKKPIPHCCDSAENRLNPGIDSSQPKAETSESRCYIVPELQVILNISRGSVYKLLQRKEFKWFQIGNDRYRISKKSFDQWLDGQS